jgi:tetratricopeptide (TPR) repeat protein
MCIDSVVHRLWKATRIGALFSHHIRRFSNLQYNQVFVLEGSEMISPIPRLLVIGMLLAGAVAVAAESTRDALLDQRFVALKQAQDESSAREIEQEIWKLWMVSGNAAIDALMQQALEARRWGDYDKAFGLLDRVIEIDAEYAEAWNQRATLHFLRGEYEQSLENVARTLELEPRHFGAMAGRGVIRLRQGRSALAIQNIKAAMDYHPFLRERTLVPPQFLDQPAESR